MWLLGGTVPGASAPSVSHQAVFTGSSSGLCSFYPDTPQTRALCAPSNRVHSWCLQESETLNLQPCSLSLGASCPLSTNHSVTQATRLGVPPFSLPIKTHTQVAPDLSRHTSRGPAFPAPAFPNPEAGSALPHLSPHFPDDAVTPTVLQRVTPTLTHHFPWWEWPICLLVLQLWP